MGRCEHSRYDAVSLPWPHVQRCDQTATEKVHVDGQDMELCVQHARDAHAFEAHRLKNLEDNANSSALLAVEKALTETDRRIILATVPSNLQGATVADLLDMYHDADVHLAWTEPFFENNEGVLPVESVRRQALVHCVMARAIIDRDVPKLGDVLALWERTLEVLGL